MIKKHSYYISILQLTHPTLVKLCSTLPDKLLDARPGPQEWSIREILAHLVDDEMFIMRTRLTRIIKEETPQLVSHDEKHWYQHRNTARDTVNKLLNDFYIQRSASLNILTFLRDQEWTRTAYHPEYGYFTAEEWIKIWTEHDLTHIRQIENNLTVATVI